jgi:putative colanic acid biosynthesis UDP-glucose lipid carrier transferase
MNKQFKQYLQLLLVFLDFALLNTSYLIAYFFFGDTPSVKEINFYLLFWFSLNFSWALLSVIFGVYSGKIIVNFESFTKRTVQVYILWVVFCLVHLIIVRDVHFSRAFIFFSISNFAVTLFLNRFIYFAIKHYVRTRHHWDNKILILGFNDTSKKLATYLEEEGLNTELVGFIEDEDNIHELSNYPIIANINDTIKIAKELSVHEIFSTITPEQNHYIYRLMNEAEDTCLRFKVVPNLSVFLSKPVVVDYIRDLPILALRSNPLEDVANRVKKRILDIVISSLVIVFILSWLIPLLSILIYLESKGPIFFTQLRTGKNLAPFVCLKFRSMRLNKEADVKQATKYDNRITKIGAFLRKTSLDEFPQFINVFRGDMSLVGPRPHMIKHTNDFSKVVDHYMLRQFLKPGITGWAQINGYRGEIANPDQIKDRVSSDLWYLEHWTVWLDLRIIFLTVFKVFKGDKNAY